MSGHIDRFRQSLSETVSKLRHDIELSHSKGKIPADYSLGFANAAIFFEHRLNYRTGEPKLYNRTTAIGSLPKPVVLQTDRFKNMMGADEIYESLRDGVMLAARNWATNPEMNAQLLEAIKNMDGFLEQMEKIEVEVNQSADKKD